MKFILNMAYREMRASWHRLLFFFLCIALGVGSIVALRSVVQNVKTAILREARSLITADLQVSAGNKWSDETRAVLDKYRQSPGVLDFTEAIETGTMLRPLNGSTVPPKLTELKAVQAQFPFYGEMKLKDGVRYDHALLKNQGALCSLSLMTQYDLKVGDQVKIGNQTFTVRGFVESEPGNTISFGSAGPRVFIDYAEVEAAGLLGFGSRARFRALFKAADSQLENLQKQLRNELKTQPTINVRTFRNTENQLSENLLRVENYLSLIGLVILVLGGIGISSVTRVFIQQKMKTIAILKCLGGNNRRVLGTYLIQVMLLGLSGSLLGILFARLTTYLLPKYYADRLPPGIEFGLTWQATLQGLLIGMLIALLFSLLPLLEIRKIKPSLVLRNNAEFEAQPRSWRHRLRWSSLRQTDWLRVVTALIVLGGLIALAGWQAGSLRIGLIFLAGLAVTALVLNATATVLINLLRQIRNIPSFALRQGVNSLYRPGNQTRIILMAVGLGVFFIISVRLLQTNLLREFDLNMNSDAADMYLIDIQKQQREELAALVGSKITTKPDLIPVMRMRIVGINAEEIKVQPREWNEPGSTQNNQQGRARNFLDREYTVTYRGALANNETVLNGKFWDNTPSPQTEISIDEITSQNLKVGVGDSITFDQLGNRYNAKITSIRRIDWRNARVGFFIVFRPGTLEDAPQNFVTAIKGPAAGEPRAQFIRDLSLKFPNVSVIDVFDIISVARRIIDNITTIVTFVGGFIFLSGVLILIGSIAMTKYHRLYESAILKTLGAQKKLIIRINLIEYAVLGLLAGLIGSLAAIALTWSLSKYGLEIPFHFAPAINATGIAATLLLVVTIGILSSWDVMVRKPLGILRAE